MDKTANGKDLKEWCVQVEATVFGRAYVRAENASRARALVHPEDIEIDGMPIYWDTVSAEEI